MHLSDEEILSRLVALNKERAAEETKGEVAAARIPDSAFWHAQGEGRTRSHRRRNARNRAGFSREAKLSPNEIEQTAAVMAVLMSATQPLDACAIAATFKQGRKATLKKVEAVLSANNNTGFLDTRDGGRTFLRRRAAA